MLNLRKLAKDRWLTQNDICKILGVTQSKVSILMNHPDRIRPEIVKKLVAHFGEDIVKQYMTADDTDVYVSGASAAVDPEIVEEIVEEVRAKEIKTTVVITPDVLSDPEIDIKAEYKKGNLEEYAKPVQDLLPENHITVYTHCDDMEPEVRSGEPVLVQLLPAGIAILPGRMYFIDLPNGGVIRYIEKEDDNKLYLKARNNSYGDIIVHRDDVQSLSLVKLILRTPRSMSAKESTATELLANKDKHLDRLLDQVDKAGDRERMLIEHILKDTKL